MLPDPGSASAWRVLRLVVITRTPGQIMDAGQTTKRRAIPAMESPVNWLARMYMKLNPRLRGWWYQTSLTTRLLIPNAGMMATLAIMTMTVCSLTLNGQGFKLKVNPPNQDGMVKSRMGRTHARNRPSG